MNEDENTGAKPVVEDESSEAEAPIEQGGKLSLRDALEVAVEATKDEATTDNEKDTSNRVRGSGDGARPAAIDNGTKSDAKRGGRDANREDQGKQLTPPAEYTAEEKADFLSLSRKGQEAQLRLHHSRNAKLVEIRRESEALAKDKAEVSHLKKLAEDVEPYLRSIGLKEGSQVALQKALKMWREFEDGDPKEAAATYLRARGVDPRELLANPPAPKPAADPEIKALRETVTALQSRQAQEDFERRAQNVTAAWEVFEGAKGAGDRPRYPDLFTDSGPRLGAYIGSLVAGETEVSKQFIALASERIPGLTMPRLIEEAYRYLGGRVDDSAGARSQDTQSHIAKSRRAAASVPGRGAPVANGNSNFGKAKTTREAIEMAVAQHRDNEG